MAGEALLGTLLRGKAPSLQACGRLGLGRAGPPCSRGSCRVRSLGSGAGEGASGRG